MTRNNSEIFSKVLHVGPSRKSPGGIQAVLNLYAEFIPGFRHISSNSRFGTVAGAFNLGILLLRMPIERLRGRKILHVHSAVGKSFVRKTLIMRWGHFLGFRNVFHCHGGLSREYYASRGFDSVRRALSSASSVIVLSDSWKQYFRETLGLKKPIAVVNNPVSPAPAMNAPAAGAPLALLFMGRLIRGKGLDYLIDALGANADRWRGRLKLIVAGSGDDEALARSIQRNGVGDMVECLGWVGGKAKDAAFARSHILVLPSFNEGLPVSILEAMSRAMPVISTPVGGIPEVIESGVNGILVPPGDSGALAAAIDRYLDSPDDVVAHGQASLRRITPYFPESVSRQLLGVYSALLG